MFIVARYSSSSYADHRPAIAQYLHINRAGNCDVAEWTPHRDEAERFQCLGDARRESDHFAGWVEDFDTHVVW